MENHGPRSESARSPESAFPRAPDRATAEALRWLAGRREAMIERLRSWCQQNSGSENLAGLRRMADRLVDDFAPLGVACQRRVTPPYTVIDEQGNSESRDSGDLLLWRHAPEAAQRLLLMIHYDTVYPPPPEDADSPGEVGAAAPAACRLESEGRLVGPGTADAKGGLLVMREALLAVRRFELDRGIGWTAVANPDEELGSPASGAMLPELAPQHSLGLLFEPSLPDGALVAGRMGSGNFTVVVRGRSAHAGRNPQEGRNAVILLCRLLAEIDQSGEGLAGVTVNVAQLHGGGALNRVPDRAVGRFNVRVAEPSVQAEWLGRLAALVERYRASEGFEVELHGGFHAPPKVVDAAFGELQRRVERAAEGIGREIAWRNTGGASDGNRLAAAGLPNVDTLGPRGDRLHSPDEWVDVDSLVPAAQTLLLVIAHYAREARQ
ncbi:hydrolase [Candidatus Laterigemmans baculatus]|uniref:hydrolase n=1 Tax=Candidatus Laterigemmans baculatus TaxID=2770505 RepID=UPI0013DB110C|nr:hydrolase [Candidatus Laterigemmans baculatus]